MIAVISFLTQIDLFGAQALLPSLVERFQSTPAAMGFAVNASTIGMGFAGLAVAFASSHINRRVGIIVSLVALAIPTALAGVTTDLTTFTWLRIIQGVFMSIAFTLTMAYLAENCSKTQASEAMAGYITGAVASNLMGRIISAQLADQFGVPFSFFGFAALNILGAILVAGYLRDGINMPSSSGNENPFRIWAVHLKNHKMTAAFAIGFVLLFAFIGIFTYVNFVLVASPISLSPGALGLVYLVFIPALFTTPTAGSMALRYGLRKLYWVAISVSVVGLVLVGFPSLNAMLIGLAMIGVGIFCAQAVVTTFVGQAATADRASASGLYLAAYYFGGVAGSFVLGIVFTSGGWIPTLGVVGLSLAIAAALGYYLTLNETETVSENGN